MSEFYSSSSLPNVHWRYYIYDKAMFYETLNELNVIKAKQDKDAAFSIIDSLSERLETDYKSIADDKEFLLFVQHLNSNQDTGKYLNLYHTLAKSKLANLKNLLFERGETEDAFNELREYYVRSKASVFYKNAWFYLNKYYASDDFFKAFIDSSTFNRIYYPTATTTYLNEDMYMNVLLSKEDAKAILANASDKKIVESELSKNDLLFLEGLRGVVEGKYVITYKID